ncbi:hypothetical protein AB0451_12660 [Streptomyces sp. NPDC052000]|uniref:hypothetical protein n=1 Tax=Streptomyces sp. NPDC052000 TaxID=3155676 RepID=UPI00344C813E
MRARSGAAVLGYTGDELEQVRATLTPVIARDPYLKVSTGVTDDHGSFLRKEPRAAVTVREIATAHDPEVC